jgi:hypothetical protein
MVLSLNKGMGRAAAEPSERASKRFIADAGEDIERDAGVTM